MGKVSLVIGGNGALGRSVVQSLNQSGWKVVSVDIAANPVAQTNILVDPTKKMQDQAQLLIEQTLSASRTFNSIICVAGGFEMGSITDANIFEAIERQNQINFQSALFAGHVATRTLQEQGLLMFTGAAAAFEGPVNYAYAYYISKQATHALAINLSQLNEIPKTSSVVTILPQMLDTPANRAAMPGQDTSNWAPTDKVGDLVRTWADGVNRPQNGSFAKLHYEQGSVFTKFI